MKKKNYILTAIIILIAIILIFSLGISAGLYIVNKNAPEAKATTVASNSNVNGSGKKSELSENEMRIPGYYEVYASADKQEIELFNPEDNTVHFIYDIKDKNTNETLYRSLVIEPGMADMWNAYEQLKANGTNDYDLLFVIETYEPSAFGTESEYLRNINQSVVCHIYQ